MAAKRAELILILQSVENSRNEFYFRFQASPNEAEHLLSAYALVNWVGGEFGNQKPTTSTNLSIQLSFDSITKAVTASYAENSGPDGRIFRPLYKTAVNAPPTDWQVGSSSQFRLRLEAASYEGAFLDPGVIGFDNWKIVVNPAPRTNEVSLDGTKPFRSIQAAIDECRSGDLVSVAPGRYQENIDFKSKDITVASLFAQTSDPAFVANTVIDGRANGVAAVTIAAREMAARLIGFTITNGAALERAGGVKLESASVATIDHCLFVGNRIPMWVQGTNKPSLVRWCSFSGNFGSSIRIQNAPLKIQNCSFIDNSAESGAVIDWQLLGGLVEIERCLFVRNTGSHVLAIPRFLSVLPPSSDEAHVVNCTFYENNITTAAIASAGTCLVLNSILLDQTSAQIVGGTVAADYSLIRGGLNAVRASADKLSFGPRNSSDSATFPVFDGSDGIPSADSAAIGRGVAVWSVPGLPMIVAPATDLLGHSAPDPQNSSPDIGAVELPFAGPLSYLKSPSIVVGRLAQSLSIQMEANNGPEGFEFADLPAWLEGDSRTGLIAGLPTQLGTNLITVSVDNQWGRSTNQLPIVILKALPQVNWTPPLSISWGAGLNREVHYDAAVVTPLPGLFLYDPPLGTVLELGDKTLRLSYVPFDTNRFETVVLTRTITVTKAEQGVEFTPPSSIVLGDGPLVLQAASSAGLPVRFELVSGSAVLSGNVLEATAGGVITIRALQPGDGHYQGAQPVSKTIAVNLRPVVTHNAGGTILREPTSDSLPPGSMLSLTALPAEGFLLDGWWGDIVSKANPLSMPVTNNVRISAVFSPRFSLSLTNTAGGTVVAEPPASTVQSGNLVTVSAIPNAGFGLYSWTGTFNSTTNPLAFLLKTNISLTAVFKRVFDLTFDPMVGGTVTVAPPSGPYFEGDIIEVSARAADGYRFDSWQADLAGRNSPQAFNLSNHLRIAASFRRLQTVLLAQSGQGQVTAVNGVYHDIGESVTVRAEAASGWAFSGWMGSATDVDNPITVAVTTNTALTAVFKPLLTLAVKAGPGGTVEINPNQKDYMQGTVITCTAKPSTYYSFVRWNGSVGGTNSTTILTIATNSLIDAVFAPGHGLAVSNPQDLARGFKLLSYGLDGVPYILEVSTGLEFWIPLGSITNRSGQAEYLDTQAAGLSRRFYRIRTAD